MSAPAPASNKRSSSAADLDDIPSAEKKVKLPTPSFSLQSVAMNPMGFENEEFVLSSWQQLYAQHLVPCRRILDEQIELWFNRKSDLTTQNIRIASTLVSGLLHALYGKSVHSMGMYMLGTVYEWHSIINSVFALDETQRQVVINQRRLLQNHFMALIELIDNEVTSEPKWGDFMLNWLNAIAKVDVEEDVIGS
jgi:hypothetical protein